MMARGTVGLLIFAIVFEVVAAVGAATKDTGLMWMGLGFAGLLTLAAIVLNWIVSQ